MEQTENTTTTTDSSGWQQRTKELVRPREGRMLAGVAKGTADNFGIAPWIVRVFFVVCSFFGGFGIVLYSAGWAFIRSEDETESPAERFFEGASSSRSWLGIGFIVIAGIIVLSNFTILSGEVIWAAALLVVGLLLYLGYLPGESKAVGTESKEGVQQMTPTDTITSETDDTPAGDTPDGGIPAPPPPPIAPPPTPPDLPPARTVETSILGRLTFGVMLLGLGVLAILDNISKLPISAQPRHYLALAVTILGVGLLVGSIAGRARWLIIVGAILVPTLLFSPIFEYDWSDEAFDVRVAPTAFTDLDGGYSADIGQIRIDLTSLDWEGEVVELAADLDIGQLTIIVPKDVGLFGSADVNIGAVRSERRTSAGLGNPALEFSDPGAAGELHLDAHVDIGDIDIDRR